MKPQFQISQQFAKIPPYTADVSHEFCNDDCRRTLFVSISLLCEHEKRILSSMLPCVSDAREGLACNVHPETLRPHSQHQVIELKMT
jgi:hypothetical protein